MKGNRTEILHEPGSCVGEKIEICKDFLLAPGNDKFKADYVKNKKKGFFLKLYLIYV